MAKRKKMYDCFDAKIVQVDEHYTIRIRKMVSRLSGNVVYNWRIYKDVQEKPENKAWWPDSCINYLEYEESIDDAETVAKKCLDWHLKETGVAC